MSLLGGGFHDIFHSIVYLFRTRGTFVANKNIFMFCQKHTFFVVCSSFVETLVS
jgi:hypothetical protein